MTSRADVLEEARGWIGAPFHHQGYDRAGCDCGGLLCGIGLALGLPRFERWRRESRFHSYPRIPGAKFILRAAAEIFDPIDIDKAQPGDMLMLRSARDPMHVALLSGASRIIHALPNRGVVEHRIDYRWGAAVCRAYRFPGIE